jgi:predicted aldo/keto reductase-like oxidoreductase
VVVMKVLAGGELHHGAPGLRFLGDQASGRDEIGSAVRYAAMHPSIATAVVGSATIAELERNVEAVRGAGDDLATFERWTHQVAELDAGPCTRCGACLDVCPDGIEIPKILRLHDQARRFGMVGVARHKYRLLETDASACRRSGRCQTVCPEAFDIAGLLHATHDLLGPASLGQDPLGRQQSPESPEQGAPHGR